MIQAEYGGSKCYHAFIRDGELFKRKMTRPGLHAAKQLPHARRRLQLITQRQKKRARYYSGVADKLARGEAGPKESPWVRWNVRWYSASASVHGEAQEQQQGMAWVTSRSRSWSKASASSQA